VNAPTDRRTVGQVWSSPYQHWHYRVTQLNVPRGGRSLNGARHPGVEMTRLTSGTRHVMDPDIVAEWWQFVRKS
jgi:hypothetical protein